jgi:hypothetical protein
MTDSGHGGKAMDAKGQALYHLFSRPVPEGKVRFWVDDHQGGGCVEYVTPEESDRRNACLARGEDWE